MNIQNARFGWLALGLALALLFAWWMRRGGEAQTAAAVVAEPPPEEALVSPPTIRHIPEYPEPITDDERAERNVARPESGSGESQLEHLFRSVVMANAEELKLTPAEVDRLAGVYLEFQEIHAELVSRFLNEINPEVGFAGSSGSALLYREQVATGEFRFLGSVLDRRFPGPAAAPAP